MDDSQIAALGAQYFSASGGDGLCYSRTPVRVDFAPFPFNFVAGEGFPPRANIHFEGLERDEMQSISTVLGGRLRHPSLSLTERDVVRLPHNLVHVCVSRTPEGVVALPNTNQTPDIVEPDELFPGMFKVIEVATCASPRPSAVIETFRRKLWTYCRHFGVSISRFNVVVVTQNDVFTLDGQMSDLIWRARLVQAYQKGRQCLYEYQKVYGIPDVELSSAEMDNAMLSFIEVEASEETQEPRSEVPHVPIRPLDYRKPLEHSFDEYFTTFDNPSETRTENTAVHCVWANPSPAGERFPEPGSWPPVCLTDSWHSFALEKAWRTTQLMHKVAEEPDPFGLRAKKQSIAADFGDEMYLRLNVSHVNFLVSRGVLAKDLDNDVAEAARVEGKKPISRQASTDDIADYIRSPVCHVQDSDAIPLSELSAFVDSRAGGHAFLESYAAMNATYDMQAAAFWDAVIREVTLNQHRNPKDIEGKRMFIVRPVPKYKAFVVMRTTRMSGRGDPPVFFQVLFAAPKAHTGVQGRVFERWEKVAETADETWWGTPFMSSSPRKAEHLQGLHGQLMSLWGLVVEQLGGGIDSLWTHREDAAGILERTVSTFRCLLLILLEDKAQTADTLSRLRYYYMEVFSGMPGSKRAAEKVVQKFPGIPGEAPLRSRLLLYFLKQWSLSHAQVPANIDAIVREQVNVQVSPEEDPEYELASSLGEGVQVESPFHYTIHRADDFLLSAYAHMLHNKNESSGMAGEFKVVDKMLKYQYLYRDLYPSGSSRMDHQVGGEVTNPDQMGPFKFSQNAVVLGAHLFKKKVMKAQGLKEEDYDEWATRQILRKVTKTTLSELTSTKSCTVPFDTDTKLSLQGRELIDPAHREKVFAAMKKAIDDGRYTHVVPSTCLEEVLTAVIEDGGLKVTMFRKAQITGDREIYVLTFAGRMAIRIYQDIYREVCSWHNSEKLMHPGERDTFLAGHFAETRSTQERFKATAYVSADKSKWAQKFSTYEFQCMDEQLLPKAFHNFSAQVLKMHREKIIHLPKETISALLRSPDTELSSQHLQRLKKEFIGQTAPELVQSCTADIHAHVDMMMGILHYTSSAYHLLYMECLAHSVQQIMTGVPRHGGRLHVVQSFEVSSDDSGSAHTVLASNEALARAALKTVTKALPLVIGWLDLLFGIETSQDKTSITISPLFEFNSVFYQGNTVASPIIKFVARACDDSLSTDQHGRVTSMLSAQRQQRESGASGVLCQWVSMGQLTTLMRNYGWSTMTWFGNLSDHFLSYTTYEGAYIVQHALISGLTDSNYQNWVACQSATHGERAKKVVSTLGRLATTLSSEDLQRIFVQVYPSKKYRELLEQLGLSEVDPQKSVPVDYFECFLRKSHTMFEECLKINKAITTPTVAQSLRFTNRIDSTRLSAYLFRTRIFRHTHQDEVQYVTRKGMMALIDQHPSPLPENLFPQSEHYHRLDAILRRQPVKTHETGPRRLRVTWTETLFPAAEYQIVFKSLIRWKWFGDYKPLKLSMSTADQVWSQATAALPFLKEDLESTLLESPFESASALLAFIESHQQSSYQVRMLSRGSRKLQGSALDVLIANISSQSKYSWVRVQESEDPDILHGEYLIGSGSRLMTVKKSLARLRAWEELYTDSPDFGRERMLDGLSSDIGPRISPLPTASHLGSVFWDDCLLRLKVLLGQISLQEAWEKTRGSIRIYSGPERRQDGSPLPWTGYGKKNGVSIRLSRERDALGWTTRSWGDCEPDEVMQCWGNSAPATHHRTLGFRDVHHREWEYMGMQSVGDSIFSVHRSGTETMTLKAPRAFGLVDFPDIKGNAQRSALAQVWFQKQPMTRGVHGALRNASLSETRQLGTAIYKSIVEKAATITQNSSLIQLSEHYVHPQIFEEIDPEGLAQEDPYAFIEMSLEMFVSAEEGEGDPDLSALVSVNQFWDDLATFDTMDPEPTDTLTTTLLTRPVLAYLVKQTHVCWQEGWHAVSVSAQHAVRHVMEALHRRGIETPPLQQIEEESDDEL